jgi:WD40 repeat protein
VGVVVAWQAVDGGRRLASSGTDGFIQVWDADTRQPIAVAGFERPVHSGVIKLVAWRGRNGVRLASAGSGPIRVWDPETGSPVSAGLTEHTSWISGLTVWTYPDGSDRLASASADGTVRVCDPETGQAIGDPLIGDGGAVHSVTSWITADGHARLAAVGDDGTIRIWDPDSGDLIRAVRTGQARGLGSLASWTVPDGRTWLAFGSADGTVEVMDPDTETTARTRLTGHSVWVHTLTAWAGPDGRTRLGSASMDGTIRIWDPQTGAALTDPIAGGQTAATQGGLAVWVGPDGRRWLATTGNRAIYIWDAETGVPDGSLSAEHTAGLWAMTSWIAAEGHPRLATAGDAATIQIWDVDTGASVGEPLARHTATVWAMETWTAANGHTLLASGADDGMICCWDTDALRAYREPVQGHAGWIPSMAVWRTPEGAPRLASGGADATIRVWDPETGTALARLDTDRFGCPWVLSLTAWATPQGGIRVAFAGNGPSVYIWDPDRGGVQTLPARHTGWIRALSTWTDADGRRRLASGGVDGTVAIWDADAGTPVGEPFPAHVGPVRVIVAWTDTDHRMLLATAGSDDAVIRIWDPATGAAVGEPLTGHRRGLWALTGWTASDGRARLASTGPDGTIRLWDPQAGRALRTIEVGPVAMWGLSDAPSTEDVLDRQRLADAIADQLDRSTRTAPVGTDGPLVVSIEGPWGSGKSTLMNLIRQRLSERRSMPPPREEARRLTVRAALRQIRRHPDVEGTVRPGAGTPPRGIVTVWFNPWAHQSGEQVWAGLTHEIIEAVSGALYPTQRARQRYWFARNLARTDQYGLRRALHRRVVSPLLGVALAAVVAPLAIALAELNKPFSVLGHTITAGTVALGVSASFLLAGVAHTAVRYLWSPAADHLPAEIFHRPVTDSAIAHGADAATDTGADPLRRARAGALYMHQHDVGDIIDDLGALGYDLVVFVDDIDRCRPSTSGEVFEAVNLFLSGVTSRSGLRAHFVIGLDPQVVAEHLDQVYGGANQQGVEPGADRPRATGHGDDPSPGWAFLRKLVQLPVLVPQVGDSSIERFVHWVTAPTGRPTTVRPSTAPASVPASAHAGAPAGVPSPPAGGRAPAGTPYHAPAVPAPSATAVPSTPVDMVAWRTLEQHPRVRATLIRRLAAQPDRSLREAKRLINLWQLYARLSSPPDPEAQPTAAIRHAEHLVLLAEIVTRWPALQRALHRRVDDRRGLRILADCARDDARWHGAVQQLDINPTTHHRALNNLRLLLQEHDGPAVAQLADRLL